MPKILKTYMFAIVLCLVCSLLLTAAATGLKQRQMKNVAVDRQRNILMAVGLLAETPTAGAAEIETLFNEKVKNIWVNSQGQVVDEAQRQEQDLPIYLYVPESQLDAYVIPIDTTGLWGKIHGYLAIDQDGSTVRGFTVYKHQETPGLGGEIEQAWFRKNFEGKQIVNAAGEFVAVGIAKGKVADGIPKEQRPHYVDGISGATLTGKYLSAGLQDILRDYEPVAVKLRQNVPLQH
ncbi:MAG: FMN-binding protein [Desulfobacterales bacterium]|jgi:Na+-transporting NADH:ubiquinone oxidoreductase subunit C